MATKIGIVGTGWVAKSHINAIRKTPGTQICAIAGRNTAAGTELVKDTGARVYDHWQKMLEAESLDAVFILLPPHLHGDLELACAGRVKGLLIEKPITNDLDMAIGIRDAFERAGTITSVSYQNRYRANVDRIRAGLAATGEPAVLVTGQWIGGIPGPYWWRDAKLSGGQFVEQCTHIVDLARYIVGEIVEVSAISARGFVTDEKNYTVDDAQVVNVRFASGAVGNITTACHLKGIGDVHLTLSTRSTQFTLHDWKLRVDKAKTPAEETGSDDDAFGAQTAAFVRALETGDRSGIRSTYADSVETLRVTLAANTSSRAGGAPVRITRS